MAESLLNVLEHPQTQVILDRSQDILVTMKQVEDWWGYDLLTRKPSPAYNDYGLFQGTDLDLACFLYALSERDAVINIPVYKSMTQTKVKTDEVLTSKTNRHGKIIGLGANRHFFSFNVKILDQNVIGQDEVGAPRTFALTNYFGNWYEGWKEIQFTPTLKENKFITENSLWSGQKIYFKNFVHPNRWTSFFGHHYVITKLLIERLEDEARYLNGVIKYMKENGVEFKWGEGPEEHEYEYGEKKSIKFNAFEVEVFVPACEIKGEYEKYPLGHAELALAYQKRKALNRAIGRLRFMTRATEMAHHQNPTAMPVWLKNVKWEPDFKKPGGRSKWMRLKLFQPTVGEHSVSILKREYEKSQMVNADAY